MCVWVGLYPTLRCVSVFFFFFTRFHLEYCGYCSLNSNRNCWLSDVNSAHMYCSRTHKLHFLSTFSLKMGPTILFTYLKIILLQCFSVFSFSFQFSAVSKRTLRMSESTNQKKHPFNYLGCIYFRKSSQNEQKYQKPTFIIKHDSFTNFFFYVTTK